MPSRRATDAKICGNDPILWEEAEQAARIALTARIELWDAMWPLRRRNQRQPKKYVTSIAIRNSHILWWLEQC